MTDLENTPFTRRKPRKNLELRKFIKDNGVLIKEVAPFVKNHSLHVAKSVTGVSPGTLIKRLNKQLAESEIEDIKDAVRIAADKKQK